MKLTGTFKHFGKRAAFTLLEVLLVLIILGVIAALVVPKLIGQQERAMILATETAIKQVQAKVELYSIEHDASYPQSLDDLLNPVSLSGKPMKPYATEFPKDAWKQPLNYELTVDENMADSMVTRIWSNGPNKQNDDGSGDDINNWTTSDDIR